MSEFFRNAAPFNESPDRLKGSVFEGGIHVPLIISWPDKGISSGLSDLICAAWDIFPTLCEVTGSVKPSGLDGISILPTITGTGKQARHEFLYWEYPEKRGQQAVRMENWKAIRDSTLDGKMRLRLYDLNKDITEDSDVSGKFPVIVKRMEAIMSEEHQTPEVAKFELFPEK